MVLNWNALQSAVVYETPYRWILFENLIEDSAKFELMKSYPLPQQFHEIGEGNVSLIKPEIAKEEVIQKMREISEGWRRSIEDGRVTSNIQDLGPVWQRLIEDLWTPTYQEVMEKLSGLKLGNYVMTIHFRRFHSGHTIWVPHVDGPARVLTHLLYFNEEWSLDWGGNLRILSDNLPESIVHEVSPLIGSSVAFVRSDNSWHTITPISPLAAHHRLTLQIVFWVP